VFLDIYPAGRREGFYLMSWKLNMKKEATDGQDCSKESVTGASEEEGQL